jgi:S-formylglutathione hydrolase FrmB
MRIAAVDARSRYGGSQYLDSPALGNYARWLTDEVMPQILGKFALPPGAKWIVAGHSSGGYGALRLGMGREALFDAVVALSPDSDLDVTHIGFARDPGMKAITRAELDASMAKSFRMPANGTAQMMLGLSANYAPAKAVGRFEWFYDDNGAWRPEVWQRWIDADPLTIVSKNPAAFAPSQRIYLDGAEHDEFGANIGARKIYDVLKSRKSPVTFLETPGHHSDHIVERLVKGILWARKQD